MGRKLETLLGKKFKSSKCKTLLKMTVSRTKILKNKRELQCRQFRKDVAQLLQNGQEESARLRVEHVFREENILAAYILIEGFCEMITGRLLAIEKQKECPYDLKEAIASLVFAAPRCADLPELQEIRSLFALKYGKEFTTSAIELRPDSGVNRQIIEKLSTRVPNIEVKQRLMKNIATEHGIEWNFEEVNTEKLKLAEDIPNESKSHFGPNQTTLKPEDGTSQGSIPGNESDKRFSMPSQSQSPATITQKNSGTYEPSPPTPPDVSNMSEQQFQPVTKQGHDPARHFDPDMDEDDLHARQQLEGKMNYHDIVRKTSAEVFMGRKQENVKYTDVASAAQAAFESAAYAAAAARAAVDLAKNESGNTNPNKKTDYSRESMSEGEDELHEALLRDQNEGKYGVPVNGLRNGGKDTKSRINDQPRESISEGEDELHEALLRDQNEGKYGVPVNGLRNGGKDTKSRINDQPRESFSEGEDELREALLRDQNEGKYGVPVKRNGGKDTKSRNNDQPSDIESSRMRNGGNVVSSTRSGFEKIHPIQKESSDSESGEECLGDQVSWSEDGPSHMSNSYQQYHDEYRHSQEEFETNDTFEEKVEPQLKGSISGRVSNSSEQSSSHKVSQPMFDDSDDDEDEHQMNFSGSPSFQGTFGGYKNFGKEDSPIQDFQHFGNQKQFDNKSDAYEKVVSRKEYHDQDFADEIQFDKESDAYEKVVSRKEYHDQDFADEIQFDKESDAYEKVASRKEYHDQDFADEIQFDKESDAYEKVVSRKEYHDQDFADEIQRVPDTYGSKITAIQPSKSYEGEGHLFMQGMQRSRPCTPHETEFDDEVKRLNDGAIKLEDHLGASIIDSQPNSNSPPKRHSKHSTGDISADNSTSSGYKEETSENESHYGVRGQYTNSLASDEGVYRYKGDGKLHWCPANLDKQNPSTESHRPSRYGISVRTRR